MLPPIARLTARGAPFELVEAEIDGIPCRVYRHGPRTLSDLYRKAESYAQREFIVSGQLRLTYGEILDRARDAARALSAAIGSCAGARVAIIGRNRPEWIIGFIAITSMGATAVAIHPVATAEHILDALDAADCTAVIADDDVARQLSAHGERRPILSFPEGERSAVPFLISAHLQSPGSRIQQLGQIEPEHPALISFTSGSTGPAKGVVVSHRGIATGLMNMLLGGAVASTGGGRPPVRSSCPVSLVAAPFSHISGYSNFLLMWSLGGRIVTLPEWSVDRALGCMEAEGATSLVGATPTMIRELIRVPDEIRRRAGSLRSLNIHGAHVHSGLLVELADALPHVSIGTGYGLTETNGSVCVASASMLIEKPTTCGQPLPTVDLLIAADDGTEVPRGHAGEIWLRGAMMMRGYCNSPAANESALCDGWFRTADLARLDSDGYLHIIDRMSRTVVHDGIEILFAEVERAVLDARLATEAAAFAVEDPACGSRTILVVVPGNQNESYDPAPIRTELARAGIPGRAMPRILTTDYLPRTASGKVNHRELRRRVQIEISKSKLPGIGEP